MVNNITETDQPLLSVVIPLYCEALHIATLLSKVQDSLKFLNDTYEIILVDDGSPDNSWEIIKEETLKLPMIRALKLSRNFGKESAICAGLERASGKAVIVMDGDLQHPPELIPKMVALWQDGKADIVDAIKVDRGDELYINKIGAGFFYAALKKFSGYDLTNLTDYKLMDAQVVAAWLKMGERNLFFRGMSAWIGFRHAQIPFEVQKRGSGRSTMSIPRLIRLAVTAVTSFSSIPLHLVTVLGGIFLIFALIMGVQTLYMKFSGIAVSGFTTVILLQLIIGSLLMMTLGIIGEYIARVYDEVKRRPRYIIEQIIDKK